MLRNDPPVRLPLACSTPPNVPGNPLALWEVGAARQRDEECSPERLAMGGVASSFSRRKPGSDPEPTRSGWPGSGFWAPPITERHWTYTSGVLAATGLSSTGNTYAFGSIVGTVISPARALRTLRDSNLGSTIGAVFVSSVLTQLVISFAGEQWRWGGGSALDQLTFGLNPSVTNLGAALTTGTFSPVTALNFNSPVSSGVLAGPLDGNAAPNRTQITATITGLSIPVNQTFAIRWADLSIASNDGLAIDDFSISVPEPGTVIAGLLAAGGVAWHQRRRLRRLVAAT